MTNEAKREEFKTMFLEKLNEGCAPNYWSFSEYDGRLLAGNEYSEDFTPSRVFSLCEDLWLRSCAMTPDAEAVGEDLNVYFAEASDCKDAMQKELKIAPITASAWFNRITDIAFKARVCARKIDEKTYAWMQEQYEEANRKLYALSQPVGVEIEQSYASVSVDELTKKIIAACDVNAREKSIRWRWLFNKVQDILKSHFVHVRGDVKIEHYYNNYGNFKAEDLKDGEDPFTKGMTDKISFSYVGPPYPNSNGDGPEQC